MLLLSLSNLLHLTTPPLFFCGSIHRSTQLCKTFSDHINVRQTSFIRLFQNCVINGCSNLLDTKDYYCNWVLKSEDTFNLHMALAENGIFGKCIGMKICCVNWVLLWIVEKYDYTPTYNLYYSTEGTASVLNVQRLNLVIIIIVKRLYKITGKSS